MTDIERVGNNIRVMRNIRSMTMQQLADRMTELGDDHVSGRMIGSWERGECELTASHMMALIRALECTAYSIFHEGRANIPDEDRLLDEIRSLSDHEKRILLWIATEWKGNEHPLIEMNLLYSSLNERDREAIAAFSIIQYKEAMKKGRTIPTPDRVDLAFLENQTDNL